MSKFQIILIAVCVVVGFVAILIFAGILPGFGTGNSSQSAKVEVSLWGVFPNKKITPLFSGFANAEPATIIKYSEKNITNYENEFINALASGAGPDLLFLSQDMIMKEKDKIFLVPFASFGEREYRDTFIDSADVFMDVKNQNIFAMPLAVDPLVLYWNRDLFSSASIAKTPQYWDEFLVDSQMLTKIDAAGNIVQSGAAMGEFRNIKNAKEILSMLILQTGNSIINKDEMKVVLGEKGNNTFDPTESSVRFFNEFSDSSKASYSWNRVLPESDTMFVNGALAMYFGYASEYEKIKQRNPHLNFDIAEVPQIRDGAIKASYGKVYSLAFPKNSAKIQTSWPVLLQLIGADFSRNFSKTMAIGPVRRDVLSEKVDDPILSVVYKSAIMSRTWLDPNPQATSKIFQDMVELSSAGKLRISEAVRQAKGQLEKLLKESM